MEKRERWVGRHGKISREGVHSVPLLSAAVGVLEIYLAPHLTSSGISAEGENQVERWSREETGKGLRETSKGVHSVPLLSVDVGVLDIYLAPHLTGYQRVGRGKRGGKVEGKCRGGFERKTRGGRL